MTGEVADGEGPHHSSAGQWLHAAEKYIDSGRSNAHINVAQTSSYIYIEVPA